MQGVIRLKEERAVDVGQVFGRRHIVSAGSDVPHQRRADCTAVAFPELSPMSSVVAGEEKGGVDSCRFNWSDILDAKRASRGSIGAPEGLPHRLPGLSDAGVRLTSCLQGTRTRSSPNLQGGTDLCPDGSGNAGVAQLVEQLPCKQ